MYLKRIELHGFKSFAPRTVLEFNPGITAIVGPNGSGKSNVADGLRWVLGEQSMRTLRGKKSDDVIFAGGQGKPPMQMAEVGLVLDNGNSWLPSDYAEVTVARRSFRSGDSEYLINGQRVRLKDVLLLLAQARIGHDSYTVIGQGLVDQALSQRAEERRGLFEDAAGIRQFQAQRADAEQKLALTQSNLARLHDIIGEIEPRLGPLAEQARRAREFASSRDELMRLLRVWYRRQWIELEAARARAESAEHDFAARIQKLQDALAVEEGLVEDLTRQRVALQGEVAALRRARGEASGRMQTTERELAVARERLASVARQCADLEVEQEQQREALAVAQAHVEALEAQLAQADAAAESAASGLDTLERSLHVARQEQEREDARLRAAQRDVIQVQARLAATQSELGRLQKQVGERNRVLAARRDAAAQAERKVASLATQLVEQRDAFEVARAAVETLVADREQLLRELADGQTELERLRAAVADLQRERGALADRLALLEEWRTSLEGTSDGVRTLLQAPPDERPPILGIVSQMVSASPDLEPAIEAALGPFLHAVVVASPAAAREAASWLRERGGGRALFLWAEGIGTHVATVPVPPDGSEILGLAADRVTCAPHLRPLVAQLLRDTLLVRDLDVADRQWHGRRPLPAPVVTLAGDMLHPDGWLRGGASAATLSGASKETSVLTRERELRQLPAELDRLDGLIAEAHAEYGRAGASQERRTRDEETLRARLRQSEPAAQELARRVAVLQRDHERAQNDVQLAQAVVDQLAAEVQGIEQEVAATSGRVTEQERAQQDAAERVETVQAEMDDLVANARTQQEELVGARTAVAVQRQEAKALGQRAEQLRSQAREVELQMARRADRLAALKQQHAQLTGAIAEHEAALAALRTQTDDLSEQLRQHEASQADLDRQTHELERGLSGEREELARLEVEYRRGTEDSRRARDAVGALAAQIRDELDSEDGADPLETIVGAGADRSEVDEVGDAAIATPEASAKMRRTIDQLRNRIKHLGGYDPDAPQVYEELKTRFDFLSSQVHDMEQASTNLRNVIAELDQTMRRQFEATFRAVNERFQRHFTALFSGGSARLELTAPRRQPSDDEEEDESEPRASKGMGVGGVEVYVQIPGKRVQDLSLLSGGERAMVSVALLFALLETNPPPFCLLDEVDAALDEANIVRFCEILKVLAENTQFIVITHNRVTATYANAIYGISMNETSISRVLSMNMAELALAT